MASRVIRSRGTVRTWMVVLTGLLFLTVGATLYFMATRGTGDPTSEVRRHLRDVPVRIEAAEAPAVRVELSGREVRVIRLSHFDERQAASVALRGRLLETPQVPTRLRLTALDARGRTVGKPGVIVLDTPEGPPAEPPAFEVTVRGLGHAAALSVRRLALRVGASR